MKQGGKKINQDPGWCLEETKKRRHKEKLKQYERQIQQKDDNNDKRRIQKDILEHSNTYAP